MAGLNVLVADDERPARDELRYLLSRDDRVSCVIEAHGGVEVLRLLEDHGVHTVFLDIAMPGFSGIELARVLAKFENPPAIVFVTAHEQYAVEAFEINVVDYLLKPLTAERVSESLRRVLAVNAEPDDDETLAVERAGVTRFIRRNDVLWVETHGDYVRLHTHDDHHLLRTPLATLAESWRQVGFVRIHRSYLVDVNRVEQLRTDGSRMSVLVNGTELDVSRRHARDLRERLLGSAHVESR